MDTQSILAELEAERDRLNNALNALQGSHRNTGRGKTANLPSNGRKGKRRMTAAARKRISDAQKRRWAKQKKTA